MIPGSAAAQFFAAGGTAATGGYEISRSLRFNSADTAYLSKTFGSAGNQTTWTLSCWFKVCRFASDFRVTPLFSGTSPWGGISIFQEKIRFAAYNGSYIVQLHTTQVLRDPSGWYHLVAVFDSNNGTTGDRARLYLNGVRITTFDTETYPSPGATTTINSTGQQRIGHEVSNNVYSDCYFGDVHFIDGQALDPTSFGAPDTNTVWQPIEYTGSYGTNGFHLNFSDNSTTAALGYDTSGNSNDWTVNNFSVITSASTGDYVSGLTTNTSGFAASTPAVNAFRGALLVEARQTNYTGNPNLTWTPNTALTNVTSLRVYDGNVGDNPYATGYIQVNGGSNLYLADVGGNQFSDSWRDLTNFIPGNGTITSISWTQLNKGGYTLSLNLYAIEVNGTILTDNFWLSDNDSLRDSPTNGDTANDTGLGGEVPSNYCTWNPLTQGGSVTLQNGNLETVNAGTGSSVLGTIGLAGKKWYMECTRTADAVFGVANSLANTSSNPGAGLSNSWTWYSTGSATMYFVTNGSFSGWTLSKSLSDTLQIAVDATDITSIKVYAGINNTWYDSSGSVTTSPDNSGSPTATITTGLDIFPLGGAPNATNTLRANFGQRSWTHTAPSGFKAICTTSLTTPTIADGSTAMDVVTYSGDGVNGRSISSLSFSPDLAWFKSRNVIGTHAWFDTLRGTNMLASNGTNKESDFGNPPVGGYVSSFDSNGYTFTNGTVNNSYVNDASTTYVSWNWDAGSSTVPNTDGTIASQVRANPSAGFSVVTWTAANPGNNSVGHGLNAPPSLIITKCRTVSDNWFCYHRSLGKDKWIFLDSSAVSTTFANYWNNFEPDSSKFGVYNNATAGNNQGDMVAYCFAPVAGYSAFGKWTGGSAAFVYLGFRPKFLLIKADLSGGYDWMLMDSKRSSYNIIDDWLTPNTSAIETTSNPVNYLDFLSNGFKIRGTGGYFGGAGDMLYAAFAEHPFKTARAR